MTLLAPDGVDPVVPKLEDRNPNGFGRIPALCGLLHAQRTEQVDIHRSCTMRWLFAATVGLRPLIMADRPRIAKHCSTLLARMPPNVQGLRTGPPSFVASASFDLTPPFPNALPVAAGWVEGRL